MPQQIEDLVRNMQRQIIKDGEQIIKLYIKNIGFEEFYGKDGDKFFRYSFQIRFEDSKHIIWKRFSQFDELHYLLKQRYQQLPQLPLKTTASLQQISPNLRSLNLQQYLQDLIKVPTIGENVHLRQFLEMKNFLGSLDIDDVIVCTNKRFYQIRFIKLQILTFYNLGYFIIHLCHINLDYFINLLINLMCQSDIGSLPQLENILQKLDKNNKDIDQLDNMKSRLWE